MPGGERCRPRFSQLTSGQQLCRRLVIVRPGAAADAALLRRARLLHVSDQPITIAQLATWLCEPENEGRLSVCSGLAEAQLTQRADLALGQTGARHFACCWRGSCAAADPRRNHRQARLCGAGPSCEGLYRAVSDRRQSGDYPGDGAGAIAWGERRRYRRRGFLMKAQRLPQSAAG